MQHPPEQGVLVYLGQQDSVRFAQTAKAAMADKVILFQEYQQTALILLVSRRGHQAEVQSLFEIFATFQYVPQAASDAAQDQMERIRHP